MPSVDDADLSQYQEVLALEQERWIAAEWNEPDTGIAVVTPSSSSQPSLSQEQDSVSDGDSGTEEVTHVSGNQFTNLYNKKFLDSAELHILQPGEVVAVAEGNNPELGLFNLFMTKTFLDTVWRWTNESMGRKGRRRCTKNDFFAYIGLEMGMSLMKFNDIHKYWSSGCFLGHDTFRTTMSRDRFKQIRSCICFSSPSLYYADEANKDLLWSC